MSKEDTMKKVLVLMRHAPYGSFYSFEGLQTLLIMGAYELDLGVAFVDDGVYVLTKEQNPRDLQVKKVAQTFPALPDFDVNHFYILDQSLKERGLSLDDLVIQPEVIDASQLSKIIMQHQAVLPF